MLQKARFIRNNEDFTCVVCGTHVRGNGYTNHCNNCLASMHVDGDSPGDRASTCHGVMEPVGMEIRHGKEYIIHKCEKCGHIRSNKVAPNDSRETLRLVSSGMWMRSRFQR